MSHHGDHDGLEEVARHARVARRRRVEDGCRPIDEYLLEVSGAHRGGRAARPPRRSSGPTRSVDQAVTWFEGLGVKVRPVMVLNRRDAQDDANVKALKGAAFVYLSDGSPLHLRSVLKESSLLAVLVAGYRNGGVLAASGAGATVLGDPMVDPRGGAYTVGLGVVSNLAIFPYHGSAADHLQAALDRAARRARDPRGRRRAHRARAPAPKVRGVRSAPAP